VGRPPSGGRTHPACGRTAFAATIGEIACPRSGEANFAPRGNGIVCPGDDDDLRRAVARRSSSHATGADARRRRATQQEESPMPTTVDLDLEIAELLPEREELGFFFTRASNKNFQIGFINQNNQANVVNSVGVAVIQVNVVAH
jgi:hypothetical protein